MNEREIERLHAQLLTAWNNRDARGMASLFSDDASVIGFDGSLMNGPNEIEKEMSRIFDDHKPASYVWKVEEIRTVGPAVCLLRAIVGMIPPGKDEIKASNNAIQTVLAVHLDEGWRISLFQNTPAQFHGRPELVTRMTEELSELI